jgi:hypothetical protein
VVGGPAEEKIGSASRRLTMPYVGPTIHDTPERRLLLAVLLNGMLHLRRGRNDPTALEAARWIRGELDGADTPCSFASVCEALDLNPGYLARRLLSGEHGGGAVLKMPRRQVRTRYARGKREPYRACRDACAG